ncbi:MAG: amidohydrolase [Acidimicrobiia bacterium]|nr:amidohydrolase [Acidimicrobiia bacterium]
MALTVDIHAHILVPEIGTLVADEFDASKDPFLRFGGASTEHNQKIFSDLVPMLTDPVRRLAHMDRQGVEIQAVAIAPPQYHYWADPDLGTEIARIGNEAIAALVDAHPDRFVGMGTLPMQDPGRAISELERVAAAYSFPGVSINPSAEGVDYDQAEYGPFWRKVEELDMLVILHPNGFSQGERLGSDYMINVVGNPLETTVALSHIVLGGVIERHPKAKILAVHGGGYLPFYMDRMDHAYGARPEVGVSITRPPSSYLKQVFFDSVVFGDGLNYLVDRVGADHVLMGTDYPYDMGEDDPIGRVARVGNASDRDIQQMSGLNAARLLGL